MIRGNVFEGPSEPFPVILQDITASPRSWTWKRSGDTVAVSNLVNPDARCVSVGTYHNLEVLTMFASL